MGSDKSLSHSIYTQENAHLGGARECPGAPCAKIKVVPTPSSLQPLGIKTKKALELQVLLKARPPPPTHTHSLVPTPTANLRAPCMPVPGYRESRTPKERFSPQTQCSFPSPPLLFLTSETLAVCPLEFTVRNQDLPSPP